MASPFLIWIVIKSTRNGFSNSKPRLNDMIILGCPQTFWRRTGNNNLKLPKLVFNHRIWNHWQRSARLRPAIYHIRTRTTERARIRSRNVITLRRILIPRFEYGPIKPPVQPLPFNWGTLLPRGVHFTVTHHLIDRRPVGHIQLPLIQRACRVR